MRRRPIRNGLPFSDVVKFQLVFFFSCSNIGFGLSVVMFGVCHILCGGVFSIATASLIGRTICCLVGSRVVARKDQLIIYYCVVRTHILSHCVFFFFFVGFVFVWRIEFVWASKSDGQICGAEARMPAVHIQLWANVVYMKRTRRTGAVSFRTCSLHPTVISHYIII